MGGGRESMTGARLPVERAVFGYTTRDRARRSGGVQTVRSSFSLAAMWSPMSFMTLSVCCWTSFSRRRASSSERAAAFSCFLIASMASRTSLRSSSVHGAHGYAALLREAVDHLHEVLPALAAEFGQGKADHGTVDRRVDADVGHLDGLFDGLEQGLVPRLDHDHAGVWRGDCGYFLQAHRAAVGFDHHALDHGGGGLAGMDGGELVQRVVFRRLHSLEHVFDDGVRLHGEERVFRREETLAIAEESGPCGSGREVSRPSCRSFRRARRA